MFISDQPIYSLEEDILGRGDFVRSLARAILRHKQQESFVIGLHGGWGFGKTSIINMALEHINFVTANVDKVNPVIIKFNPWNFSEQNQIIFQFFRQFAYCLKHNTDSLELNEAGQYLKEIAAIFQPLTITSALNSFIESGPPKTEDEVIKAINEIYDRDINTLKEQVSRILAKHNNKIIIIIDDIDRLNVKEIKEVFQIVKCLANFPNTVYILSFNKDVVLKSLSESIKGCSATEYLEDIIQVPFIIPTISEGKLYNLLYSEIIDILKDDKQNLHKEFWETLYSSGLVSIIKDIRSINRYLNVLKFDYELVKGDVDIAEFLTITALQVFEPYIYDEIKNNKELFCYGSLVNRPLNSNSLEKLTRRTFDNIVQKRERISDEELKDLLSWLFPKIMDLSGIMHPESVLREYKNNTTVADIGHFDTYFKSSIIDTKISSKKINRIISRLNNAEEIKEELLKFEDYEISDFLDRLINPDQFSSLSTFINEIKIDHVANLVIGLISCGDELYNDRSIDIGKINSIVVSFIDKIPDNEKRYNILKQAINYTQDNLYTSSLIVYNCIVNRLLINQEHIYELREIIRTKVETYEKFSKHENLALILINLKKLGYRSHVNGYIDKLKYSNEGFIHLISTFISKGERKKGVGVRSDSIKILLPLSDIESKLKEIRPAIDIDKLDEHKKYVLSKIIAIVKSTQSSSVERNRLV